MLLDVNLGEHEHDFAFTCSERLEHVFLMYMV